MEDPSNLKQLLKDLDEKGKNTSFTCIEGRKIIVSAEGTCMEEELKISSVKYFLKKTEQETSIFRIPDCPYFDKAFLKKGNSQGRCTNHLPQIPERIYTRPFSRKESLEFYKLNN